MSKSTHVLTVVGARPQFIKAAPLIRALAAVGVAERLLHTGQHFDELMSDVFFAELDMAKPTYNLEVNSLGHGGMTGRMLEDRGGLTHRAPRHGARLRRHQLHARRARSRHRS